MRFGLLLSFLFLFCSVLPAAEPAYGRGTKLESLTVGTTTYREVEIRSINARTIILTHASGMASVRLRDLSPELQRRFNYDPSIDAEANTAHAAADLPKPSRSKTSLKKNVSAAPNPVAELLRQFGQPALIQPRVDLRPKFFELELGVKNQGRRPSCAIFAIVSALEFQTAELTGAADKLSEEYLTWATWRTVQRIPAASEGDLSDARNDEDADLGFTLREVVAALRGYGIPLQSSMPNTFGRSIGAIADPPATIVDEARRHQRVFVHEIPGRDNATRINNLVHALNAGVPVAVGMSWPHFRVLRNGYLSGQTPIPGSGHAVTVVGYLGSESGRIEDVVFVFKNSWGMSWGQGGYGTVTYGYLDRHLGDAVVLEVQAGQTTE